MNPFLAEEVYIINSKLFDLVLWTENRHENILFVPICTKIFYVLLFSDGVISYSMRQGDRRGSEVDLYDFTYDGVVNDNILASGLGQLTDGEEGHTNFRLDTHNTGQKGYEWVGWKNESTNTQPIELIFEFDKLRNFTSIRIHCNNMFSKDVRVFRMAKIYFSIGGKYFVSQHEEYHYMRDALMEFARHVIIPVNHRVGRFVKIQLYFDARWVMISEVRFDSGWWCKSFIYNIYL